MHQDQDDTTTRRIDKPKLRNIQKAIAKVPLQFTSAQSSSSGTPTTMHLSSVGRHYSQPPVVMIQSAAAFGPQQYMVPHVYMPRGGAPLPKHSIRQGGKDVHQPLMSPGGNDSSHSHASTSDFYYPCLPDGTPMYHPPLPYRAPFYPYVPSPLPPHSQFLARNISVRPVSQPNPTTSCFPKQFPVAGKPTIQVPRFPTIPTSSKLKGDDAPLDLSIKTGAIKLLEQQQLQLREIRPKLGSQFASSSNVRSNETGIRQLQQRKSAVVNLSANSINLNFQNHHQQPHCQVPPPSSSSRPLNKRNKVDNEDNTNEQQQHATINPTSTSQQRPLSSYMHGPNLTSKQVNSLLDDIYMSLPGNRKVMKVAEPVQVKTSVSTQQRQQRMTNAFQQFCKEQREQIRQNNPYKKVIVNNTALGRKWKSLSGEERQVYCDMAAKINESVPSRKRRRLQKYTSDVDWVTVEPKLLPPRCKAASHLDNDEDEERLQPSSPDPDAYDSPPPSSSKQVSQALALIGEESEESTVQSEDDDEQDSPPETISNEETSTKDDEVSIGEISGKDEATKVAGVTPTNDEIECVIISSDEEDNDDDIGPYPSAYVVDVNNRQLEDHPVTIKYRPGVERFSMTNNHSNGDSAVSSFENLSLVGAPMVEMPFDCIQPVTPVDEYLVAGNFIHLTNKPMIFCSTHTRRELVCEAASRVTKQSTNTDICDSSDDGVEIVDKEETDSAAEIDEIIDTKDDDCLQEDELMSELEDEIFSTTREKASLMRGVGKAVAGDACFPRVAATKSSMASSCSSEYRPNFEDGADSDDSL